MRLLELKKTLEENRLFVFNINDIAKITQKDKKYLRRYLSEQIKKENIIHLKRGFYSFTNLDKFEYSRIFENSYLSLNSAIEYYGLTTQIYRGIQLISKSQKREQIIQGILIKTKKIASNRFFGFKKEESRNTRIFVADYEKMLIDSVYFSNTVYLSEIDQAIIKIKDLLDIGKLADYLKRFDSDATTKRLGYILDINGIDISDKVVFNKKYELLNKNLSNKGEKNDKWKIIINETIKNEQN